jgi:hypothetical protein
MKRHPVHWVLVVPMMIALAACGSTHSNRAEVTTAGSDTSEPQDLGLPPPKEVQDARCASIEAQDKSVLARSQDVRAELSSHASSDPDRTGILSLSFESPLSIDDLKSLPSTVHVIGMATRLDATNPPTISSLGVAENQSLDSAFEAMRAQLVSALKGWSGDPLSSHVADGIQEAASPAEITASAVSLQGSYAALAATLKKLDPLVVNLLDTVGQPILAPDASTMAIRTEACG